MDKSLKHKEIVAGIFNRTAPQYGNIGPQFFSYFSKKMVEHANIVEGQIILDAACGRGSSIFPAQKKVGNSGKVIGIDISTEMIKHTQSEIKKRGLKNVELHNMDVEDLKFSSNMFDVVLSGLSLFFLPDLEKTLSEIKRVLKSNGIFVTSTFGEKDDRWESWRKLMGKYQKNIKPPAVVKTKMLDNEDEINLEFKEAGFENIQIFSEKREFYYKNSEEWWKVMWAHGYRGFLELLDKETLEKFKAESFEIISSIVEEKGIPEKFDVIFTKAIAAVKEAS